MICTLADLKRLARRLDERQQRADDALPLRVEIDPEHAERWLSLLDDILEYVDTHGLVEPTPGEAVALRLRTDLLERLDD